MEAAQVRVPPPALETAMVCGALAAVPLTRVKARLAGLAAKLGAVTVGGAPTVGDGGALGGVAVVGGAACDVT